MDQQGTESKRPRLSTSSWSAASHHGGVSLPHPAPPPHRPTSPSQYHSSSHSFPRPSEPPHPPPPLQIPNQHYDDRRPPQQEYDRFAHGHPHSHPHQHPHGPHVHAPPPPRQDQRQDFRQDHRQDPRQQSHPLPPSPAHLHHSASYPGPGRHEPSAVTPVNIKRDPVDEPPLRRPLSTPIGPDQAAPGIPHPHPPPHALHQLPPPTPGPPPPTMQHQQQPPLPPQQQQPPHQLQQPHPQHPQQQPHPQQPHPQQPHPQHPPQQPPPHPMDDRRQAGSFDNGHPPHMNRPPPNYPPPPPTPSTPYESLPQMFNGPPSAGPESILFTSYTSSTAKRKAQRASQACDNCRQLKAKCDETKPCKNCREKKVECKYRDPIPKQQDKFASDILDILNFIKSESIRSAQRLERIERHLKIQGVPDEVKREFDHDEDDDLTPPGDQIHGSPVRHDGFEANPHRPVDDETMDDAPPTATDATPITGPVAGADVDADAALGSEDNDPDVAPGSPVAPGQSSIVMNHKTPAGLLLRWPAISNIVGRSLEREGIKYASEYPLKQEEHRGLLRLYGRGEGQERNRFGRQNVSLSRDTPRESGDLGIDHGQISLSADSPDVASSPSPDNWGVTGSGPFSPSNIPDPKSGGPKMVTSGSGSIGSRELDVDPFRVRAHVQSYVDNIQNMHPIIFPKELDAMVDNFLNTLPTRPAPRNLPTAKFAQSEEVGSKRKRSPTADGMPDAPAIPLQKVGRPYRTISSAVVLCAIALGKICAVKDRLPEPVPDDAPTYPGGSNPHSLGSPALHNGFPQSPIMGSPPAPTSHPLSAGYPSPMDPDGTALPSSRRSSFHGPHPGKVGATGSGASARRNMDVIPGLDYFAVATDIIGNQVAGCSIYHVYANVLAGLYYGQLGRVLESYRHICIASQVIQQLLRSHFSRLSQMIPLMQPDSIRDNRLTFAFWTCLQLESDIIAELPLPASGILQYEEKMPYPSEALALESGISLIVVRGYTAQLFLRKQLNTVHKELYNPNQTRDRGTVGLVKELSSMLTPNLWCDPHYYHFSDDDPPATEFLQARLRAKYWGANVITFRPIIRAILNSRFRKQEAEKAKHAASDQERVGGPNDLYDEVDDDVNPNDPEIIAFAKQGIKALTESTRAFHNIPVRRLIITNVFGTAHAQWGNLITLAAIYRDPILHKFVDHVELQYLFRRTIDYLSVVAHPTSALATDKRILENLMNDLDPSAPGAMHPNSSFSSTSSGDHVVPGFHAPPGSSNYPVAQSPTASHGVHLQSPVGGPYHATSSIQSMSYAAVAAAANDVDGGRPQFHPPPPIRDKPGPDPHGP